jgi:Hemerythrin HHE cation binding domain
MKLAIPKSLKIEHAELHTELAKAIKEGGEIGNKAKAVAEILHPHFVKEEEFALPPLGLLSPLAQGKIISRMKSVLKMTNRLKADLPQMLKEHKKIVKKLKLFSAVAIKMKKPEYVRFSEKLIRHAQNEEEVLYPAAILIGEYLNDLNL